MTPEDKDKAKILSKIELKDLDFYQVLGKGSFGEVRLATHISSGHKVAVKKIDKTKWKNILDQLRQEVIIHKRLKHKNILKLYSDFEDDQYIYLILEFASIGNLFQWI